MLACSAARAFALSLLDRSAGLGSDGATPNNHIRCGLRLPSHEVVSASFECVTPTFHSSARKENMANLPS